MVQDQFSYAKPFSYDWRLNNWLKYSSLPECAESSKWSCESSDIPYKPRKLYPFGQTRQRNHQGNSFNDARSTTFSARPHICHSARPRILLPAAGEGSAQKCFRVWDGQSLRMRGYPRCGNTSYLSVDVLYSVFKSSSIYLPRPCCALVNRLLGQTQLYWPYLALLLMLPLLLLVLLLLLRLPLLTLL